MPDSIQALKKISPQVPEAVAATLLLRKGRIDASRQENAHRPSLKDYIKRELTAFALANTPQKMTGAYKNTDSLVSSSMYAGRTVITTKDPAGVIAHQFHGGPTMWNFFKGLHGGSSAKDHWDASVDRNDRAGKVEAALDGLTCTSQTAFGLAAVGVRSTTVASACLPAHAGLAAAATTFTFIGDILFPILSGFLGIWGIFQSLRAQNFYERHVTDETFKSLNSVFVPEKEITRMIAKERGLLRNKGIAALKKAYGPQDKDFSPWALGIFYSSEALDTILATEYFQRKYPELPALKEHYLSQMEKGTLHRLNVSTVLGLLLKLRELQLTNEARVEQAVGRGCLEKIKKAAIRGLQARLQSPEPSVQKSALAERSALIADVKAHYAEIQKLYRLFAVVGVLGAVVGALVFLINPAGAVFFALILAYVLFSIYVDICAQKDSFDGQPGSWDKKLLLFGAAFMLVCMAGSVGVFLLFGGSVLTLALLLGLGVVALCIYGRGYYKANQQQKKWKDEHPSLSDFAARLKQLERMKRIDKKTLALFKKLPQDIRKKITLAAKGHAFSNVQNSAWELRFGKKYLRYHLQIAQDILRLEENEVEQLSRAVNKTAKFFWTQWWYANKNEVFEGHSLPDAFKEQALILEELLEGIRQKDLTLAQRAYAKICAGDRFVQDTLYDNIQSVFKREESVLSLYRAVQTVQGHNIQKLSA